MPQGGARGNPACSARRTSSTLSQAGAMTLHPRTGDDNVYGGEAGRAVVDPAEDRCLCVRWVPEPRLDSVHADRYADAGRPGGHRPPRFPQFEDCCSFTTWCYRAAGGPDPNGRTYNGQGFTGTQIATGTECRNPRPAIWSSTGRVTRRSTTSPSTLGTATWSATARKRAFALSDGLQPRLEGGRQQVRSYLG
jgi:hypothetical protein